MSRLDIKTPSRAQTVVEGLYRDVERRIAASPPGLCPVEMSLSFLQLCHAQTCGKCVPCRIGLGQLTKLISQVLDGTANMDTVRFIEKTARSIVDTADCAIGRDAARLVVDGLEGFRDDYEEHVQHHRCLASLQNPVPCVALCPAGVDIPGYMALVGVGRYADAVRLIRKDNPFPSACAYICEHPCEARCRRNMIDDAVNIRGLKRYAVDNAGYVPQPDCAEPTGKKVAVIGGGHVGLEVAHFLCANNKVTIVEMADEIGASVYYITKFKLLPLLREAGVTFRTGQAIAAVDDGSIRLRDTHTGQCTELKAEAVVLAMGSRPDLAARAAFDRNFDHVVYAGDAVRGGTMLEANRDAFALAWEF